MAGKGSAPRPFSVSQDKFAENFEAIFRRGGQKAEAPSSPESDELAFRCTCGEPMTPHVVHRSDAPCYMLEAKP